MNIAKKICLYKCALLLLFSETLKSMQEADNNIEFENARQRSLPRSEIILSFEDENNEPQSQNLNINTNHRHTSTVELLPNETYDKSKNLGKKIALGIPAFFGFCVTFTLEVMGATGAFWGTTEVLGLRNVNNDYYFKIGALTIGALALVRYVLVHGLSQDRQRSYTHNIDEVTGYEKIYKAFDNPIPAIKISFISFIHKCKNCNKKNSELELSTIEKSNMTQ